MNNVEEDILSCVARALGTIFTIIDEAGDLDNNWEKERIIGLAQQIESKLRKIKQYARHEQNFD